MALLLTNSAEGGAAGATVTTGNSGGTSGTAWSTVAIGTDATAVFDSAQVAHGGLGYRVATGVSTSTVMLSWTSTVIGTPAQLWGRVYVYVTNFNPTNALIRIRSGGIQVLRIMFTSSGKVELRESGNSVVATSTTSLSVNTWYRLEFRATPGTTATSAIRLYAGDSTTLLEEVSSAGNFSSATTVDEFGVGVIVARASLPDSYIDDMAVGDTTWLGPTAQTQNATAAPVGTGALTALGATTGNASAALTAAGALTPAGTTERVAGGATTGSGALAASAAVTRADATGLTGIGLLTAVATAQSPYTPAGWPIVTGSDVRQLVTRTEVS